MEKDFPRSEFDRRWENARERMERRGIDALLVTEEKNYRYFSGHRTRQFVNKQRPMLFLLPLDGEPVLLIYGGELPEAEGQTWVDDVRTYTDVPFPPDLVTETIRDLGLDRARIGAELGTGQRLWLAPLDWQRIQRDLSYVEFVDGGPIFERCRAVKSDREIERIERACEITADAWDLVVERVEPGTTMGEAARIGLEAHVEAGADVQNPGFAAIDLLNRGADYEYGEDDFFFFHFGANYEGYRSDVARLATFGEPSARQREVFEQVVEMEDAVIDAVRPGIEINELVAPCNEKLEAFGYDPLPRTKRIGHGIGLDFQEAPSMNGVDDFELEPGTVLTPEPRFVTGGEWIMVEENVVVTEDGARALSPDSYRHLRRIDG